MPLSPQQRRIRAFILAGTSLMVLVLGCGFYLGQRAAYSGMGIVPEVYRDMQKDLPAAREEIQGLEDDLEVERTRHEVDRTALEMVRREIAGQKERITDLEQALQFYRSLMAPGEIDQGLSLRAPELVALDESGRYAYRLVVQQEARTHQLLKGKLEVEVYGLLGMDPVSYPLSDLADATDAGAMALRFRYFQAIEGEMTLPAEFTPRGIKVTASASSPKNVEVRADYPWQLQEKFTHVGK